MLAVVNVNGIRWDIELQKRVMEHVQMCFQNIPIGLGDTILSFLAVDGGKLEGGMDKCIKMCQV
jgi:hypothetical protein